MVKRARVVIGANFGDEGKGLMTDYLCAQGAGVVVRFNGGAQAGHTVVTPTGQRHVFGHVGSGAFHGIPTFLSQFFICNPILFFQEMDKLSKVLPAPPEVFAHPECLVTTFADMIINQELENRRKERHGSVGVGISETVGRSDIPQLKITMADLWNGPQKLRGKLEEICTRYAEFRIGKKIDKFEVMLDGFIHGCEKFAEYVAPAGIADCAKLDPVFEGAQGLLLDQNNKTFFPHVTRSNTGSKNARELCKQVGLEPELFYVSRTYLTRHGAGPLPGENQTMRFDDDTNLEHEYQGVLRFAPLNGTELYKRCGEDADAVYNIVFTHCDQLEPPVQADYYSYGPTRDDIRTDMRP